MKPIVIYHANCVDGFAAAWAFWHANGDSFDYHAAKYNEPPPDILGRRVFLVDFSYKREVVEQMLLFAESITLIDHHKSALEDLQPLIDDGKIYSYCSYDNLKSGCVLAWEFVAENMLLSPIPPLLMEVIQYRDVGHLWRSDEQVKDLGVEPMVKSMVERVMASLFSYEFDFKEYDNLMKMDDYSICQLADEGEAILRKHKKDLKTCVDTCKRYMIIGKYMVPVAGVPYMMASDACNLMCKGVPFAATYIDTKDNREFSLRSDPNDENAVDVSVIAKQYFNGGGHKHAAGFKVPRNHPLAQC